MESINKTIRFHQPLKTITIGGDRAKHYYHCHTTNGKPIVICIETLLLIEESDLSELIDIGYKLRKIFKGKALVSRKVSQKIETLQRILFNVSWASGQLKKGLLNQTVNPKSDRS